MTNYKHPLQGCEFDDLNPSNSTPISESQRQLAMDALNSVSDFLVACEVDCPSIKIDIAAIRLFIEGA